MKLEKNTQHNHPELGMITIVDFISYGNGTNKIAYTKGLHGGVQYLELTDEQIENDFGIKTESVVKISAEEPKILHEEKPNVLTNTTDSMREMLFDTLRGLRDGSVTPETAKAVNETSQSIINTLKVELDYIKITGRNGYKPKLIQ
jgi:hypothetical protein